MNAPELHQGFGCPEAGGGVSNTPPPAQSDLPTSAADAKASAPECLSPAFTTLPVVCDTLYLHFVGIIAPWLVRTMRWCDNEPGAFFVYAGRNADGSAFALSATPDVLAVARWRVARKKLNGFQPFDYYAEGVGPWRGVRMIIGDPKGDRDDVRACLLMIGSEVLHQRRTLGSDAYTTAREILDVLSMCGDGRCLLVTAPQDDRVKPTRVDLCCDHFGHEWDPSDRRRFARRGSSGGDGQHGGDASDTVSTDDSWCFDSRKGRTIYIGSRRSETRFLRIYDKTAEAEHSGKLPWLEPLWRAYGWKPPMRVFRAEVEHGGGWLKAHGCTTLAHLVGCERALWQHYTQSVRHVEGRTRNLRMEEPSPIWSALMVAADAQPAGTWQWKPRDVSADVDMRHLLKQAAGCLASVEDALLRGGAVLEAAPVGSGELWTPPASYGETRARLFQLVSHHLDEHDRVSARGGCVTAPAAEATGSRHVEPTNSTAVTTTASPGGDAA